MNFPVLAFFCPIEQTILIQKFEMVEKCFLYVCNNVFLQGDYIEKVAERQLLKRFPDCSYLKISF